MSKVVTYTVRKVLWSNKKAGMAHILSEKTEKDWTGLALHEKESFLMEDGTEKIGRMFYAYISTVVQDDTIKVTVDYV